MQLIENNGFGIFDSKFSGKDYSKSKSGFKLDETRHRTLTSRKRLTLDSMSHVHKKLHTGKLNVVHPVIEENLLFATKYS